MKGFRRTILKTITTFALVIALAAGMAAGFMGKAEAGAVGTYDITFNGNGGQVKQGSTWKSSFTANYLAGIYMSFPAAKNGSYQLLGFDTNKNATNPTYKPGDVIHASGNKTYYAIWKKITVHYYVRENDCYPVKADGSYYDVNGDFQADKQVKITGYAGGSYFWESNRVSLENPYYNFVFVGWKATNRQGKEIDITGLTIQQALNIIGRSDEREIYVTAIINY